MCSISITFRLLLCAHITVPFMFELMDADQSGRMSGRELAQFVKDIYGNKFAVVTSAQKIVKEIPLNDELSKAEFSDFMKHHQGLANPVIHLQTTLREKVVGTFFWQQKTNERLGLNHDAVAEMIETAQRKLHSKGGDDGGNLATQRKPKRAVQPKRTS